MAKNPQPLRGEAAWLAAKKDIAKRNEAARRRAGTDRIAHEAMRTERRRASALLEASDLPVQPGR